MGNMAFKLQWKIAILFGYLNAAGACGPAYVTDTASALNTLSLGGFLLPTLFLVYLLATEGPLSLLVYASMHVEHLFDSMECINSEPHNNRLTICLICYILNQCGSKSALLYCASAMHIKHSNDIEHCRLIRKLLN